MPKLIKPSDLFDRGPYGELLPPPLIAGVDPDEALDKYLADSATMGKTMKRPTRGNALNGAYNAALLYWHNLRLREVLAGDVGDDVEAALHEAVVHHGEPISLRPPSLEQLAFSSFAPVFQCLTPGAEEGAELTWRVGAPEQGRSETFKESDPAAAVALAQKTYVTFCKEDDAQFDEQARAALAAQAVSPLHDYWLAMLEEHQHWECGGGYGLTLLGRHTTMQLDTPTGARIIETDRDRAVRLCEALAKKAGVAPMLPAPGEFADWLKAQSGEVGVTESQWALGKLGLPAQIKRGGAAYALVQRGQSAALYLVEGGQYTRKVAEVGISGAVETWLTDPEARPLLLEWAFWKDAQAQAKKKS